MQRFAKNKWRFTQAMVEDAPATRGIYALWQNDSLVCLGRADGGEQTIRSCLLELLQGAQGEQSRQATHYSWEICVEPRRREMELLRQMGQGERAEAAVTDLSTFKRSA